MEFNIPAATGSSLPAEVSGAWVAAPLSPPCVGIPKSELTGTLEGVFVDVFEEGLGAGASGGGGGKVDICAQQRPVAKLSHTTRQRIPRMLFIIG